MTTSANLDLVRSIYADWERGEFLTNADWAHPNIEFVVADGPEPNSWTGLAGMADGVRTFLSAWEDARIHVDEYRDLDEERLLVLTRLSGRGRISGLSTDQVQTEGGEVFYLRDAKVVKLVAYWDRDRALADLGLGPEADASVE